MSGHFSMRAWVLVVACVAGTWAMACEPPGGGARAQSITDIVIVLDVSDSMRVSRLIFRVKEELVRFLNPKDLELGANIVFIPFHTWAYREDVRRFQYQTEHDLERMRKYVQELRTGSQTHIEDALERAYEELHRLKIAHPQRHRLVMLWTDGENNPPSDRKKTFEQVRKEWSDRLLLTPHGPRDFYLWHVWLGADPEKDGKAFAVIKATGDILERGSGRRPTVVIPGKTGLVMERVCASPQRVDLGVVPGGEWSASWPDAAAQQRGERLVLRRTSTAAELPVQLKVSGLREGQSLAVRERGASGDGLLVLRAGLAEATPVLELRGGKFAPGAHEVELELSVPERLVVFSPPAIKVRFTVASPELLVIPDKLALPPVKPGSSAEGALHVLRKGWWPTEGDWRVAVGLRVAADPQFKGRVELAPASMDFAGRDAPFGLPCAVRVNVAADCPPGTYTHRVSAVPSEGLQLAKVPAPVEVSVRVEPDPPPVVRLPAAEVDFGELAYGEKREARLLLDPDQKARERKLAVSLEASLNDPEVAKHAAIECHPKQVSLEGASSVAVTLSVGKDWSALLDALAAKGLSPEAQAALLRGKIVARAEGNAIVVPAEARFRFSVQPPAVAIEGRLEFGQVAPGSRSERQVRVVPNASARALRATMAVRPPTAERMPPLVIDPPRFTVAGEQAVTVSLSVPRIGVPSGPYEGALSIAPETEADKSKFPKAWRDLPITVSFTVAEGEAPTVQFIPIELDLGEIPYGGEARAQAVALPDELARELKAGVALSAEGDAQLFREAEVSFGVGESLQRDFASSAQAAVRLVVKVPANSQLPPGSYQGALRLRAGNPALVLRPDRIPFRFQLLRPSVTVRPAGEVDFERVELKAPKERGLELVANASAVNRRCRLTLTPRVPQQFQAVGISVEGARQHEMALDAPEKPVRLRLVADELVDGTAHLELVCRDPFLALSTPSVPLRWVCGDRPVVKVRPPALDFGTVFVGIGVAQERRLPLSVEARHVPEPNLKAGVKVRFSLALPPELSERDLGVEPGEVACTSGVIEPAASVVLRMAEECLLPRESFEARLRVALEGGGGIRVSPEEIPISFSIRDAEPPVKGFVAVEFEPSELHHEAERSRYATRISVRVTSHYKTQPVVVEGLNVEATGSLELGKPEFHGGTLMPGTSLVGAIPVSFRAEGSGWTVGRRAHDFAGVVRCTARCAFFPPSASGGAEPGVRPCSLNYRVSLITGIPEWCLVAAAAGLVLLALGAARCSRKARELAGALDGEIIAGPSGRIRLEGRPSPSYLHPDGTVSDQEAGAAVKIERVREGREVFLQLSPAGDAGAEISTDEPGLWRPLAGPVSCDGSLVQLRIGGTTFDLHSPYSEHCPRLGRLGWTGLIVAIATVVVAFWFAVQ